MKPFLQPTNSGKFARRGSALCRILLGSTLCLHLSAMQGYAKADYLMPLHETAVILVKGKVTDSKGEVLPGVSILVKGTQRGGLSDENGNYQIEVSDNAATLIFSFLGYVTREVSVGNQSQIDVVMVDDSKALDELVVIGYGTAKKSDLTGSIARVDAKAFQNQPMTQLTDMLTGTVAGFQANQGTSAAGGSSMEIRGVNSLNAATSPMVVLDGVIFNGSIKDINPNDIETMDILKDASSAAVYGARAASGVILITTKKGTSGKPTINLSTRVGVTQVTSDKVAFRNPQQYLDYRRDYLQTLGGTRPAFFYFNPQQLPAGVSLEQWRAASANPNADNTREWLSRLNFFPEEIESYTSGQTTDWAKEVLQNGIRQEYDLSVGGRSDKLSYYWSLGYQNNEGIVKGDKFSTIRSRLNLDLKVTDWLNVGLNTQYAFRDESSVVASLASMYTASPYSTPYNADGSIKLYPNGYVGGAENPLINYKGQDRLFTTSSIFAALYTEIKLPLGITYRLSFQPRMTATKDHNFWSPQTVMGSQTYSGGFARRENMSSSEWLMDNLIKWNRKFGPHQFDVTLLYNMEQFKSWGDSLTNQGFAPSANLGVHGMQYGDKPTMYTNDIRYTGDGLMARVNYTLLDKYLITGSVRRDGYSGFGQSNPYAYFPAAALAWQVHKESFFRSNIFDQLKARASWGRNGNREIGPYASFSQLGASPYYNGSATLVGVYTSTLANSNLSWEETESLNFGVDAGLFKNRIEVTMDYYMSNTRQLLVRRSLPSITGFNQVTTNIGALSNRGFELTVKTVNVQKPNFNWESSLIFSLNRNKITRLFGNTGSYVLQGESHEGEVPDYTNKWFPGHSIDAIWDYDVQGIWQEEEAEQAKTYGLRPGDYKVADLDGNGALEALQDKTFIGYTVPRSLFGFRNDVTFLKHFSASIFIRADLGHLRSFPWAIAEYSTFDRRSTANYDYWTPENRSNEFPRLGNNKSPFGGGLMPYKSSAFVRIQDISLGYSVPSDLTEKIKMRDVRVFGAVRNAFTFTKWPGWDPESGNSPMPRTFTFGLNLSL
ncbi:SusC/RagA family TonB-linked outer membrane protein [Dyadobacter fanqingshengii]|uniref:SusC/RagA family TonB-linked outer membrane protein n=1 Tax=Dyadobacter fanqingshengii TaxID=2906443 RepID=A0A9X1PAF7_9BACT|nr:SusC/RagA family TonB-linked outer membrane protein [Dyadobacter fanqingshengii]MCF0041336.1 SusC/RagA family TonB-linked outer membrane protein [Dyadobacter fanqingshengii]USJ36941.1 SusC/RagA family TonB-linked outer membrane protein [Dyadobacter fanqingshengii]